MVSEWFEASRTLKAAIGLTALIFVVFNVTFFSPYWLESIPTEGTPNPRFVNLGLWHVCMNGYFDAKLQYEKKFYGCMHIRLEEYGIIQDEIQPPFFVAVQFFYTLSFIAILIAIILVMMYLLCVDEYYRVSVLRWTGIDLIVAGNLAAIALIIFGSLADNRDYMPDWENNYLSWSFGLGVVGAVFDWVAGVLFIVEARIMTRKDIARERQFPMEQRV